MNIYKTTDPQVKPTVTMLVYGEGGVGKTTFAATAPKPLILDCENGSKYFGLRGITVDVARIEHWEDIEDRQLLEVIRSDKYDTIIVDPVGEAMEKLINSVSTHPDTKMRQKDGSPTMAGWGYVKHRMRKFVKFLRDSGKHVVLIAHLDEKSDEERMVKRPMIATKISQELVNMVDIVGYMTGVAAEGGESKRVIIVDPTNDKYTAKDRTGLLGRYIEPDFSKIVGAIHGTESYSWAKPVTNEPPATEPEGTTDAPESPETPAEPEKVEEDVQSIIDSVDKALSEEEQAQKDTK